jgi:tRNA(fMet)-specific endonuclease VapC
VAAQLPDPPMLVVDTDVLSYLYKQDTRALLYSGALRHCTPVISAQTLAEIYHWPERGGWGAQRRMELDLFIERYAVEYPDRETCRIWGWLTAAARKVGRVVPPADAWQAAAALRLEVPLVTHNAKNYEGIPGLTVISRSR